MPVQYVIFLAQYAAVYSRGARGDRPSEIYEVQRRTELADQTKPALFVPEIPLDAKTD